MILAPLAVAEREVFVAGGGLGAAGCCRPPRTRTAAPRMEPAMTSTPATAPATFNRPAWTLGLCTKVACCSTLAFPVAAVILRVRRALAPDQGATASTAMSTGTVAPGATVTVRGLKVNVTLFSGLLA